MTLENSGEENSFLENNQCTAVSNGVWKQYERIQMHEHHFNEMQTELRKLGSLWLLAALGAIAHLIRDD